jgi:hypothetical protein
VVGQGRGREGEGGEEEGERMRRKGKEKHSLDNRLKPLLRAEPYDLITS